MRETKFDNVLCENKLHITHDIKPEEFSSLRTRSGMKPRDPKLAVKALAATLYMVGARNEDGELIAFARAVGDGATSILISDVMVDKNYQKRGVGSLIFSYMDEYLETVATKSTFICLIADKPSDKLYSKFGFSYLERSVGMFRSKGY